MATNFQYFLDGLAVSTTLLSVEFFPAALGGLFDLNFTDGNSLNLYGRGCIPGILRLCADPGFAGTRATLRMTDLNFFTPTAPLPIK